MIAGVMGENRVEGLDCPDVCWEVLVYGVFGEIESDRDGKEAELGNDE